MARTLPVGDLLSDLVETYADRAVDLLGLAALRTGLLYGLAFLMLWALFGPDAFAYLAGAAGGPLAGLTAVSGDPGADPAQPFATDLPLPTFEFILLISAVATLAAVVVAVLDGAMVARARAGTGGDASGDEAAAGATWDAAPYAPPEDASSFSAALRVALARLPSLIGAALIVSLITFVLLTVPLALLFDGVVAIAAAGDPSMVPESAVVNLAAGGLGTLVGGLVALFLYLAFFVYLPAVVVEDEGAVGALRRSWALTKGHRLRILLVVIVVALIAGVVGFAVSAPFLPFLLGSGPSALQVVPGAIGGTLTAPLFPLLAAHVHRRVTLPAEGPAEEGGTEGGYVPLE